MTNKSYGTIYLIPSLLGDNLPTQVLPDEVIKIIRVLNLFIVENEKTARNFIKSAGYERPISSIRFFELNEHTPRESVEKMLAPVLSGESCGVISEAGCPGVADPGAEIVALAHKKGIRVVPLAGPSSILLALMASGLNGQNFAFNGYLPKEQTLRIKRIKELESLVSKTGQTQIFMETPYRNNNILKDLLENCNPGTNLCIASDITQPGEMINTLTIAEWKKSVPDLDKIPTIFILG